MSAASSARLTASSGNSSLDCANVNSPLGRKEAARTAKELTDSQEQFHHLMRTDPDPYIGHRAHPLLLVVQGQPVAAVARLFATAGHCVRTWREGFLVEGRAGLLDRAQRKSVGSQFALPQDALPFSLFRRVLGELVTELERRRLRYGSAVPRRAKVAWMAAASSEPFLRFSRHRRRGERTRIGLRHKCGALVELQRPHRAGRI